MAKPKKKFEYVVEGIHVSGKFFRKDFVVFADDEVEAKEALEACLEYSEQIKKWTSITLKKVEDANIPDGHPHLDKDGPFTLYAPEFDFIEK